MIQLIDIVEELHVLLFCFDESGNDFIDVIDASSFHNSLESFLNNLCITYILIKKSLFLQVLVHNGVETNGEDFDWVCKLLLSALTFLCFHRTTQTLVVEFDLLVFFFKLLLKSLDICLKGFFALLMLALQRQDLIVRLGRLPRSREAFLVGGA